MKLGTMEKRKGENLGENKTRTLGESDDGSLFGGKRMDHVIIGHFVTTDEMPRYKCLAAPEALALAMDYHVSPLSLHTILCSHRVQHY
jgi:hypothetical protein